MKALAVLFVVTALVAEAQVQTPQPSPSATITTVVGLTDVKVEYSRPKAKGRKIFGSGSEFLVPYTQLWRTAANNGSRVTFSDDVKFGGQSVSKGTYLLLTIPDATDWTVILYKDVAMGGNTSAYDKANDAARAVVKSQKLSEKVETFTIEIADLSDDSKTANLQISWENTTVKVPITVDFDGKVMKSIEASTKISPNNLYQAAVYYFENGKDMKQALDWITTASAANPDAYWVAYQKAKIQKAMGDKKGAMESATLSKAAATKEKNMDYVKMNDELMKTLK